MILKLPFILNIISLTTFSCFHNDDMNWMFKFSSLQAAAKQDIKELNLDVYQCLFYTFYWQRDSVTELSFTGKSVRCHASESFCCIIGSNISNAQISVTTRYDISTTCKLRIENELITGSRDKMLCKANIGPCRYV